MNKRYLIHLAFRGTAYSGWQWQKDQKTIQKTIENTLLKVLGKPHKIHGCGRTDAGVHASQYFAHADLQITDKDHFIFIMNKNLPSDITFLDLYPVNDRFNAQKSAIKRTYRYFLHFSPDPILNDISCYTSIKPAINRLNEAAEIIRGTHDFSSFTLTPDRQSTTVCTMYSCRIIATKDQKQLCLEFSADHFLKAMVRMLVSEFIFLGTRDNELKNFNIRLKGELPKNELISPAYPQGLYLSEIQYPDIQLPRMVFEPFSL